jgi:hypothetical protein
MLARTLKNFGRPEAPGVLGDAAEELVSELTSSAAWQQFMTDSANSFYQQAKVRFEADKDELAGDMADAFAPKMTRISQETLAVLAPQAQADLYKIYDDAQTQARIGQTQNQFIKIVAVGAFATAITTWLLVRYAGSSK